MAELNDIENAVESLSDEDLAAFRSWFAEFDGQRWDRQIEWDAEKGRLNQLVDEALNDLQNNRCNDL